MTEQHVAVAIVGGGPSGLTAAAALAGRVDGKVLVIEREAETGGIPRHSDHPGYGMRDLKRFISGPAYARRLTAMAQDAGAALETEAMVTNWAGERRLQITSPRGIRTVTADAVVLATGARERPRPARLVPGDRPDGVYTTGQLQNLVHLHHAHVGGRALIVGAELVSWSAVLTLREAGCATVGMVSGYPRSEAYAVFRMPGRFLMGGPVFTRSRIVGIDGKDRVRAAVVENIDTGSRVTVDCDTRGVHRRLDPRPRTRPHRRPGDGSRDSRAGGRRRPADQQPRGVRGRQPAAPRRHRRRRRVGWTPCRRRGKRLAGASR